MKYSVFNNVKFLIKNLIRKDKVLLLEMIGIGLISAFMPYIVPILTKEAVLCITESYKFKNYALVVLILICIFIVLRILYNIWNLSLWWRIFAFKNSFVINRLDKVMSMPYENLEKKDVLDKIKMADHSLQGNDGIEGMLYSLKDLGIFVFRTIISITIVSILSPFIVVAIIIVAFFDYKIGLKTKQKDNDLLVVKKAPVDRRLDYWSRVTSDFSFAKEIRLFSLHDWILDEVMKANRESYELIEKSKKNWFFTSCVSQICVLLQKSIIYAFLIFRVYKEQMTIDNFVFYSGCILVLFQTIGSFLNTCSSLVKQSVNVNHYRSLIEIAETEREYNSKNLQKDHFVLELKNVSFRYEGQSEYALKNVNMVINSTSKIAIVGENGSGKTTLVKLICRLYQPTSGEILLNGINVQSIDLEEYLNMIAPVFQDINIFALTMKQNICFQDNSEIDDDRLQEAVRRADLNKVIEESGDGLDTELLKIISDEGVDLSGGEKQKVAIARSLYKDARLIVMDEPSSALDPLAEKAVYTMLNKMIESKAGLYISHRLSSTHFCDCIYMMKKGVIAEVGTHKQLMEKKKLYYEMFQLQAQYYV